MGLKIKAEIMKMISLWAHFWASATLQMYALMELKGMLDKTHKWRYKYATIKTT